MSETLHTPTKTGLRILRNADKHPLGFALTGNGAALTSLYKQGLVTKDGFITDAGRAAIKAAEPTHG